MAIYYSYYQNHMNLNHKKQMNIPFLLICFIVSGFIIKSIYFPTHLNIS